MKLCLHCKNMKNKYVSLMENARHAKATLTPCCLIKHFRNKMERVILEKEIGRIRDVAVGKDGAIYLLSHERLGGLYRLAK